MLLKTTEIIGADFAGIHILSKDIIKSTSRDDDKDSSESLTQNMIHLSPELLTIFQNGADYLTDGDFHQYPALKCLLQEYKAMLTVPVTFDEMKEGIFIMSRKSGEKPFSISDKRLMNVVADMLAIKISNTELFQEIKDLSLSLMKSFTETIEEKDPYTRGHSERVNEWCLKIGTLLRLTQGEIETLNIASILHDIGKVGVPEEILNKPGKLSDEEYHIIKQHPLKGHKILSHIKQLEACLPAILYHHERIDGKGYPEGLACKEIPLIAKIIAVADTYDAMTSHRAYRQAKHIDAVVEELLDVRGKQLDAEITNLFISKCLGIKLEKYRKINA